jgi:NAD(P)-dependent dehydrogenase (short-subunit alcohol dehydrogenase family)
VVAVARSASALAELAAGRPGLAVEVADASDPSVAGALLDRHDPDVLVLAAGARPLSRPLHRHTWETFSVNWDTDVRVAFHWLREALLRPLRAGSRVIVISSGAALAGSPLSGGYAGAKATQRFLTGYARDESERAGLGITFTSILPKITPHTGLGRPAVEAYAARAGISTEQYIEGMGGALTPETAGRALVELARPGTPSGPAAYLLTADGLQPLP